MVSGRRQPAQATLRSGNENATQELYTQTAFTTYTKAKGSPFSITQEVMNQNFCKNLFMKFEPPRDEAGKNLSGGLRWGNRPTRPQH